MIARADNGVDMRYMINMAYSTDLPINTMGRRVRTRLYFTSESHLHTMLNVLRFGKDRGSVLSEQGLKLINGTSELCYLTQIVMRLFEDSRWELTDPRRFRVEILFSPGATATPLHMHEQDRDNDPSRFDTAPLEMIGRDGLTCQELEDFFDIAVMEGATEEDEPEKHEVLTATDINSLAVKSSHSIPGVSTGLSTGANGSDDKKAAGDIPTEIPILPPEDAVDAVEPTADKAEVVKAEEAPETEPKDGNTTVLERQPTEIISNRSITTTPVSEEESDEAGKEEEVEDDSKTIRDLERKYFWSTVAVGSFMLAASCLVLAMNIGGDSRRARRYPTKR